MLGAELRSPLRSVAAVPDAPRLVVACEDGVLLQTMVRVVSWLRPGWTVEGALGLDALRRTLRERACDVVCVSIEPTTNVGAAMLRTARQRYPHLLRVAYRTTASCDDPELRLAHEVVSWPADLRALLAALDRACTGVTLSLGTPPTDTPRPPAAES